jgi:hypothetical protein
MTMFVCLAYRKCIEDLYSKYSFIDKCSLASPEEYKSLWKDISMVCLDVSGPGWLKARQDVKPFWLHVQDALNGMLCEWGIEGFNDGTRGKKFVMDDNKLHLDTDRTDKENANLKKEKHVSDNRGALLSTPLHSKSVAMCRTVCSGDCQHWS